jgi:nucleobase:cation symporter-1, NCS1 family
MLDQQLINSDLAPVPEDQKTWSLWHIAALWVGMAVCIPTYTLASGMVDQGWSWKASVAAVTLGNIVVLFPMLLNAHAGTRYGIPFPVLLRSSFGVLGANIPALMRAFVACGWFGIQTWIGGSAIYVMLNAITGNSMAAFLPGLLPDFIGINTGQFLCFMAFWAINVLIIYRGMESIKFMESWGAPLLILMGVALFVWAWMNVGSISTLLAEHTKPTRTISEALLGSGITMGVAFWGTLALNIPDFSRYAKSQKDQVIGQTLGLVPTMAAFCFVGAVVTNASVLILGERIADPVQLVAKMGGGVFLTLLTMLGLAIATLTTNLAANVVGPANDFSNLSPRYISFRKGAMITATIGILMMPWKLMTNFGGYLFTWLIGYGAMLGSVAGIMIADYFFIRRTELDLDALYKRDDIYEYSSGFNPVAIIALILGIAPCIPGFLGQLNVIEASSFWTAIYERAWFVAFLISSVSYLIGMRGNRPEKGASYVHQGTGTSSE